MAPPAIAPAFGANESLCWGFGCVGEGELIPPRLEDAPLEPGVSDEAELEDLLGDPEADGKLLPEEGNVPIIEGPVLDEGRSVDVLVSDKMVGV
jgi:hypothetical protein